MKKTLWLDVDGVLLEWTQAFLIWSGLASRGVEYKNLMDYDLGVFFPSNEEYLQKIYDFNNSIGFADLKPLASKIELEILRNMGFRLKVISQVDGNQARLSRIANLTRVYGDMFDGIEFTSPGQCKLAIILAKEEHLGEDLYIIEDSPTFLTRADRYVGHAVRRDGYSADRVFAVVHPYNEAALRPLEYVTPVTAVHSAVEILMRENSKC